MHDYCHDLSSLVTLGQQILQLPSPTEQGNGNIHLTHISYN